MSHGNKCFHEDNRKKVCAPCGKKIIFGKKKSEKFFINANTENLIKKFICEDFDLKNEKYPLSICTTCSLTLLEANKGKFQRPFQKMPNYTDILLPKDTRTSQNTCNCYICLIGHFKGHVKINKGKGRKRNLQNKIDVSTGLYGRSTIDSLPVSSVESKDTTNLLCGNCFQDIGRGKSHICKNSKENVLKIVEKLTEKNQNQVLSSIIKNKVQSANLTTKKCENFSFNVSAGVCQTKVVLNPSVKKSVSFDEESLWPKKLKLVSKNYHGDAFEGNACRKLLKEADKLNDEDIYEKVGIFKILPYIAPYKAMNKIVDCCFISGKIGSSLDSYIQELGQVLGSIENLSETLKIHVILAHVKESLQYIENGFGLGFWSEQSGEPVHRQFLKTWESHKINNVYDESYGPRLQKVVTEFSSLHL